MKITLQHMPAAHTCTYNVLVWSRSREWAWRVSLGIHRPVLGYQLTDSVAHNMYIYQSLYMYICTQSATNNRKKRKEFKIGQEINPQNVNTNLTIHAV